MPRLGVEGNRETRMLGGREDGLVEDDGALDGGLALGAPLDDLGDALEDDLHRDGVIESGRAEIEIDSGDLGCGKW